VRATKQLRAAFNNIGKLKFHMNVLDATNLCFGFESSGFSVRDVSVQVAAGEILGFLGKNGAGKTTVMRLILRVLPLSSGRVQFLGLPLRRQNYSSIGVLIERGIMYPNLSADENLLFHCGMRGLESSCAKNVVRELKIDFGAKTVRHLSAGMRQKLGIAIALLGRPRLLILDEPFSGLDPAAIEESLSILRRFAFDGGAILFSSHQLSDVERIATTITVIASGAVSHSARLAELVSTSTHILRSAETKRVIDVLTSAGITAEFDGNGAATSTSSFVRIHGSTPTATIIKLLFSAGVEVDEIRRESALQQFFREDM
jgi:ABC-type multidrug transport system ATPase subunit